MIRPSSEAHESDPERVNHGVSRLQAEDFSAIDSRSDEAESTEPANPLMFAARLLRGRLVYVAVVAIVLAGLGGMGGFLAQQPSYTSIGIIQVSANKRGILYNDNDDSRLRLFDAFVSSEAAYLGSRPVLERALSDHQIEQIGWQSTPENLRRLRDSIKIEPKNGLITVIGSSDEPETAAALTNSLLDAYEELHVEHARRVDSVRERQLTQRETDLLAKLGDLEAQIREAGKEYGLQSIASAHVRKISQIQEVDQRVAELENTIASREAADSLSEVDTGDVEIKRLVVLDHALADMLFDRATRAAELSSLPDSLAGSHPAVRAAKLALSKIDEAIEDRRAQLATLGTTGALTKAGKNAEEESLQGLRALLMSLSARASSLRREARELNERFIRLQFLDKERAQLRHLLDEARRALEEVRVESQNTLPGTIEIRARGSVPSQPASDKRKVIAAVGVVGGAGAGAALVLAFAFLLRRLRYSDDLASGVPGIPLAGVLPHSQEDPSTDQNYVRSVHRLRNQLQLTDPHGTKSQIVVVTGTTAGSGTTTTSLSLARSFAASRQSTVVVDADLVRGNLTHQLGIQECDGFREALMNERLNGEVRSTDQQDLSVVASGVATQVSDHCVSKRSLADLFAMLRHRFDLVIVDVGSFDDRLVAELSVTLADRVVVVVPSNSDPSTAIGVANRVEENSRNVQLVFNFARRRDPNLPADLGSNQ